MRFLRNGPLLTAVIATLLAGTALASSSKPIIYRPDFLVWKNVPDMPGVKMTILSGDPSKKGHFVARVKIPANYTVAVHEHPIAEYDTVISGTYYLGTGKKADKSRGIALTPGTFAAIPAKTAHYGWTKEETILQVGGVLPWDMIWQKG